MKLLNPLQAIFFGINFSRLGLILNLMLGSFVVAESVSSKEVKTKVVAIKPYSLNYSADIEGMKIKATHQLQHVNGQYKVTVKAKNFLGKITEHSSFKLADDGNIIPLKYTKQQKALMGNRSESQQFNWASKTLSYAVNGSKDSMALASGQFDRISLIQQVRLDLALGKEKIAYTIIRKGRLKKYEYQVIGSEIISTNHGPFNSLLVVRQGKDASKKTKIWFALDWDFVILKMQTFEKGSKKTMVLDHGQLNGSSILPLKHQTEI